MIPAFWCVLAAALLPYVFTLLAKSRPTRGFNHHPREFLEQQTGWRKRAHWAQQNGFEAFAPFAAAVLIAHLAGADPHWITALAVAFLGFRLAHGICYLADLASLRSLVWAGGMGCVIGLFVLAA